MYTIQIKLCNKNADEEDIPLERKEDGKSTIKAIWESIQSLTTSVLKLNLSATKKLILLIPLVNWDLISDNSEKT